MALIKFSLPKPPAKPPTRLPTAVKFSPMPARVTTAPKVFTAAPPRLASLAAFKPSVPQEQWGPRMPGVKAGSTLSTPTLAKPTLKVPAPSKSQLPDKGSTLDTGSQAWNADDAGWATDYSDAWIEQGPPTAGQQIQPRNVGGSLALPGPVVEPDLEWPDMPTPKPVVYIPPAKPGIPKWAYWAGGAVALWLLLRR